MLDLCLVVLDLGLENHGRGGDGREKAMWMGVGDTCRVGISRRVLLRPWCSSRHISKCHLKRGDGAGARGESGVKKG